MTDLSHPDGRLRELASYTARLLHKQNPRDHASSFKRCPHPDCVLVRAAVPVEEAALMDLEPIKARVVAATKGPWIVSGLDRADGERWVVFDGGRGEDSSLLQDQDAEFIAHARTDIPALIAEIERLRASPGPVAGASEELQQAFRELIVSAVTDSETCVLCRNDVSEHVSGCPIPTAITALERATSSPPAVAGAVPAPQWQPIESAPKTGPFLVYHNGAAGRRVMVADGQMLAISRASTTPQHLSGHHWTHWMPLPSPPRSEQDETP